MSQRNRLTTVLATCNLSNDLGCDIASSREAMRLLNHGVANNGSVLQHIFQVHQITVVQSILTEIVNIMEVDNTVFMSLDNIRSQQHALTDIFTLNTGHVVTLGGCQHSILV